MRSTSARSLRRLSIGFLVAIGAGATLAAQIPSRNVNMVSGTEWPGGDPFLQRQNEPTIAASTRNPLHLVGGSNDYRTVDLPGLPGGTETGDAWLSVYKSFDGGQRWSQLAPVGHVDCQGHRRRTHRPQGRKGLRVLLAIPPPNGNLCPRVRQSERNSTADAAIAAGDNGNLAVKVKGLEMRHAALRSVV